MPKQPVDWEYYSPEKADQMFDSGAITVIEHYLYKVGYEHGRAAAAPENESAEAWKHAAQMWELNYKLASKAEKELIETVNDMKAANRAHQEEIERLRGSDDMVALLVKKA